MKRKRASLARNLVGIAWLVWAGFRVLFEFEFLDDVSDGVLFGVLAIPATLAPIAMVLGLARARADANPWPGFSIFLGAMALIALNMGSFLSAEAEFRAITDDRELFDSNSKAFVRITADLTSPLEEKDAVDEGHLEGVDPRRFAAYIVYTNTGVKAWYRGSDDALHLFEPTMQEEFELSSLKVMDEGYAEFDEMMRSMEEQSRNLFYLFLSGLLAMMPATALVLAMNRDHLEAVTFNPSE
ncbi:MAG: hypothetical protein ACPG31_10970 [Planctomycetota bacterium]